MRLSAYAVLPIVAFTGITLSRAAVVDFQSVVNPDLNHLWAPALTTQGFTFTSGHFHIIDSPATCTFGGCVTGAGQYLGVDGPALGLPVTMTAAGGGTFSLNGFSADQLWLDSAAGAVGGFPNATSVSLSATVSGGGTLSTSLALNGGAAFQSFSLPSNWSNLLSVTFSGTTGATTDTSFALDTIVVNAVPEPGTVSILVGSLAILAAGGKLRRHRSNTYQ